MNILWIFVRIKIIKLNKTRIFEIAKKLNLSSKEIILKANELNMELRSHLSSLNEDEVTKLINALSKKQKIKINTSIKINLKNKEIVGTQRIWPARAFTLGHLTHNDLASVRIAKRATKSL